MTKTMKRGARRQACVRGPLGRARAFLAAGLFLTTIAMLPAATTTTAHAQAKLPWADANPLERLFGKPREPRRPLRRGPSSSKPKAGAKAEPGVPAMSAVPVPNTRPATAAADGSDLKDAEGAVMPDAETAAAKAEEAAGTAAKDEKGGSSDDPNASAPPIDVVAGDVVAGDAARASEGKSSARKNVDPVAETDSKAVPGPDQGSAVDAAEGAPSTGNAGARKDASGSATPPEAGDPAATAQKPVSEIPVPEARPAESPASSEASDATKASGAPAVPVVPLPADIAKPADAPNSTDKLKARVPAISPATAVLAAAAIEDAELCEAELEKRGVEFSVGDSISEGECGVLRPVDVTRLSSGVTVSPDTQFLCRTALALDDWMTKGVIPEARADFPKARLLEFRHASTYVCRPRASESAISEHARGSAIDVAAFVFDDDKKIGVDAQAVGSPEAAFQDAVRAAACGPFKTVLGPGTDADHATHFHLDIAARENGSTYCR